jgi:hypothetical protein
VAGCCEYGDEPSGSGATELVNNLEEKIQEESATVPSLQSSE